MSHTWSNSLNGAWYDTFVVPGADLSAMDGFLASLLNGDGGGTWTPSALIRITGAGIEVLGPWTLSGTAVAQSTTFHPFVLGDSDFFVLGAGHASATRVLESQCVAGLPSIVQATWGQQTPITWGLAGTIGSIQSSIGTPGPLVVPISLVVPLRVHDGAAFTSAVLKWSVGVSHSGIPENLPKWRIVSISTSGQITPLNTSFVGNYDSQGYLLTPTPASTSAYYNSGNPYDVTYACDTGIIIDTSKFDYAVEIVDEWGPSALVGNNFFSIQATFIVADMRFQT